MARLLEQFERQGDKKNSPFFEEYIGQILDRREQSGLDEMIGNMIAVVVQITPGDLINYMSELYMMTAYRFHTAYSNDSHKVVILKNKPGYPDYILLEPHYPDYRDAVQSLNYLYPRGRERINTRYLGEIYQTKNLAETRKTLESHLFRFQESQDIKNEFIKNKNFEFTHHSNFTQNVVGYTESNLEDYDSLNLGEKYMLDEHDMKRLEEVDAKQKELGLFNLVEGIDHIATRVFCGRREDAILEFLCLSNYYFWGAYTIEEMNSSTNICRNPKLDVFEEMKSPAKVFTANNTPFYVNSINQLPSPTEDFVRNFGNRLHHIAYAVPDGEVEDGRKNIDYVVQTLSKNNIDFLAKVFGECTDFPDLKQIFSKTSKFSVLITEYVQRCHGFRGFFTKGNVAALTEAAGMDEALKKSDVCD